jgi:hypothetical protein
MMDDMSDTDSGDARNIFWFDRVSSTMDKAREMVASSEHKDKDVFTVVAGEQIKGRGTKGRQWLSGTHNLYMTSVIKMSSIRIPLTLLPLQVGNIISRSVQTRVLSGVPTYLKWPNDVLIGDQKVCGVLIEIEDSRILIGIGCNVGTSPAVAESGRESGRPSACIRDHREMVTSGDTGCGVEVASCDESTGVNMTTQAGVISDAAESSPPPSSSSSSSSSSTSANQDVEYGFMCKDMAAEIHGSLKYWLTEQTQAHYEYTTIIRDFENSMNFAPQYLRKEYTAKSSIHMGGGSNRKVEDDVKEASSFPSEEEMAFLSKGEEVVPLGINTDGTLRVRRLSDDSEVTLVADYIW